MVRVIAGVDPGLHGAVAFYFPEKPNAVLTFDMPICGGEVNDLALNRIVERFAPDTVWLERVHSMPKNSASSMFKFGCSYSSVRCVFAINQVRIEFVTPPVWKKYFRLGKDKDESRKLAISKFPASADQFELKKHEGRAEAALIALYGLQQGKH